MYPQQDIIINSINVTNFVISFDVEKPEIRNGLAKASITLHNPGGRWNTTAANGNLVEVKMGWGTPSTIFKGKIYDRNNLEGDMLEVFVGQLGWNNMLFQTDDEILIDYEVSDIIKHILTGAGITTTNVEFGSGAEHTIEDFHSDYFPNDDTVDETNNITWVDASTFNPSNQDDWTEDHEEILGEDIGTEGETWTKLWTGTLEDDTGTIQVGTKSKKLTNTSDTLPALWRYTIPTEDQFKWQQFKRMKLWIYREDVEVTTDFWMRIGRTDKCDQANSEVKTCYIDISNQTVNTWQEYTFEKDDFACIYEDLLDNEEFKYIFMGLNTAVGIGKCIFFDGLDIHLEKWDSDSEFILSKDTGVKQQGTASVKGTHRKVYFEDDFNTESVNTIPNNWVVSGAAGDYWIKIMDYWTSRNNWGDIGIFEGNRSVNIYDKNTSNQMSMYKELGSGVTGTGIIEFVIRMDRESGCDAWLTFLVKNNADTDEIGFRAKHDYTNNEVDMEYKDSGGWHALTSREGTYYPRIKITYNETTATYDLEVKYGNLSQSVTGKAFITNGTGLKKVQFETETTGKCKACMDVFFWGTESGGSDTDREFYYHSTQDEAWNCEIYKKITFHMRQNVIDNDAVLRLYSSAGNFFYRTIDITTANTFQEFEFDIGTGSSGWSETGTPDWEGINWIAWFWSSSQTTVTASYIDKLYFTIPGDTYYELSLAGDTTELFSDNFDSETTGSDPSNWTVSEDSNTDIDIDDTIYYGGSGKSCRFYDNNSSGSCSMVYTHGTDQEGLGYLEWYWRKDGSTSLYIRLRDNADNDAVVLWFFNDESIRAYNGTTAVTLLSGLSVDTWYKIKVVYDVDTQTYDIYVDGVLIAANFKFYTAIENIRKIRFNTGTSDTGNIYVDSVSWYSIDGTTNTTEYKVDSFEDDTVGQNPAGWTCDEPSNTNIEVVSSPVKVGSKAVRLDDNSGTGGPKMTFVHGSDITGLVHVSYYFRNAAADSSDWYQPYRDNSNTLLFQLIWDGGTNAFIYHNGTSTTIASGLSDNTWYKVDLIIDVTTYTCHCYFDGAAKLLGMPFQNNVNLRKVLFQGDTASQPDYYMDHFSLKEQEVHTHFTDGFEEDTVGQNPSNWVVIEESNTNIEVVSSPVAVGSKACMLDDNSGTSKCYIQKNLTYPHHKSSRLEWRFRLKSGGTGDVYFYLFQPDDTTSTQWYVQSDGDLYYYDGAAKFVKTLSLDTWYKLRLDYDSDLDKFAIYVDDSLEVSNANFQNAATTNQKIRYYSGPSANPTEHHIDEVKWEAYVHYPGGGGGSGYETEGYLITHKLLTGDFEYFDDIDIYVSKEFPGGCSVTPYASNDDGATWDEVSTGDFVKLTDHHSSAGNHGRILKIKIVLAGDGSGTPKVYGIEADVKVIPIVVLEKFEKRRETRLQTFQRLVDINNSDCYIDNTPDCNFFIQGTKASGQTLNRQKGVWDFQEEEDEQSFRNKVYLHGALDATFPLQSDDYCEGDAASWTGNNITVSDDTNHFKVNIKSIRGVIGLAAGGWADDCQDGTISATYFDQKKTGSATLTEANGYIRCYTSPYSSNVAFLYYEDGSYELTGDFEVLFDVRTDDAVLEAPICAFVTSAPVYNKHSWLNANIPYIKFDAPRKIVLRNPNGTGGYTQTILKSNVSKNTWYNFKIKRVGSTHTIYINGEQVWSGSLYDSDHTNIQFGDFRTDEGEQGINIDYDNFVYKTVTSAASDLKSPTFNKNLDLYNSLHFWYSQNTLSAVTIRLETDASNYFSWTFTPTLINEFYEYDIPVGSASAGWSTTGSPTWQNITCVRFVFASGIMTSYFNIDELHFRAKEIIVYSELTTGDYGTTNYGEKSVRLYDRSIEDMDYAKQIVKTLREKIDDPIDIVRLTTMLNTVLLPGDSVTIVLPDRNIDGTYYICSMVYKNGHQMNIILNNNEITLENLLLGFEIQEQRTAEGIVSANAPEVSAD